MMRNPTHQTRGGFTLIEILLGMGIAIMVIVGVVAVSVATTRLTATIADAEAEALRVDMLERILRDNLEHLPQQAAYVSLEPESGSDMPLLAIENAFGAFSLGSYGMSADRYVFRPVPVDGGGLTLRLEYYLQEEEDISWFEEPYSPDPSMAVASIDLMGGLSSVSWWQLMAAEEEWIPIEILNPQEQPAALRLDMVLATGEAMSWTFRNPMWKLDRSGGIQRVPPGLRRGGGNQGGDQNGGQGADQGNGGSGRNAGQGRGTDGGQSGGGQQIRPRIPTGGGR